MDLDMEIVRIRKPSLDDSRIYQEWRKAPYFSYGDISHTLFPVKVRCRNGVQLQIPHLS